MRLKYCAILFHHRCNLNLSESLLALLSSTSMLAALKRASAARAHGDRGLDEDIDNDDGTAGLTESLTSTTKTISSVAKPKEPFDINGLRQTGLYSEEYIQELLSGIPPELVCDTGRPEHDLSGPRRFAPLPKKRRMMDGTALASADALSITSSSNETAATQITLYDNQLPSSYSTPATSSSDEADAELLHQDRGLINGEDMFLNDDAKRLFPLNTPLTKTIVTPRENYLDTGKRDRVQIAPGAEEDNLNDQRDHYDDSEDILGKRLHLLTLSAIQDLVKGVAEGKSLFGGAGLVAAVAGMGLHDVSRSSSCMAPPLENAEMEEFAKMASWATTYPTSLDRLTSLNVSQKPPPQALIRDLPQQAFQEVDAIEHLGFAGVDDSEHLQCSRNFETVGNDSDEEAAEANGESVPIEYRHDAFDANDKERWAYQEQKLLAAARGKIRTSPSAIVGSANTKKRKVPAAPAATREAPALSRRVSLAKFDSLRQTSSYGDSEGILSHIPVDDSGQSVRSGQLGCGSDADGWREAMKSLLNSLIDAADPKSLRREGGSSPTLDQLAFARGNAANGHLGNTAELLYCQAHLRSPKRFTLSRLHLFRLLFIEE